MPIPTSYPAPAPPMATAFYVPSQDEHDRDQVYWDAYKAAQATAAQQCPSATNIPDWYTYHAVVIVSLPPRNPWDARAAGAAQAIFDLADKWEWRWNPNSGENRVF